MSKKNALALSAPAEMGLPTQVTFAPNGKKKKGKKNRGMQQYSAPPEGLFVDDVADMAVEVAAIGGLNKFYFADRVASIEATHREKGDAAVREAIRADLGKHILGAAVARRFIRKGTILHQAARAAMAVAAVRYSDQL